VPANTTSRKLHKFVPIVSLFAAAVPIFLEIMKDWSTLMISAGTLSILILKIILPTALIDASKLALFG
jgi:hypothetical protein